MSITTSQLVINSTNYDKNENYFVVPFGVPQKFINMQMSVSQINIFNSFSNISTELGNNWITINFPDGTGFKPYTFTIPSGFYNQVTFLAWLKTQLDENYLYTLSSSTSTIKKYPIGLSVNLSYQSVFSFSSIQTGSDFKAGGTWTLPTVSNSRPYIVVPVGLGKLFGFTDQQTTIGNGSTVASVSSKGIPQLNQVQSLVVSCNLIASQKGIAFPSDLLSTLPVAGATYGGLISKTASKREWFDIQNSGEFREVIVRFRDQNLIPLKIYDTNILILLSFRKKPENKII